MFSCHGRSSELPTHPLPTRRRVYKSGTAYLTRTIPTELLTAHKASNIFPIKIMLSEKNLYQVIIHSKLFYSECGQS